MAPDEYTKAFDKSLSDLLDRVQRRDLLNAEIAGLRETVRVLSSRVEMTPDKQRQVAQLLAMVDYATPNLTDAIRALLTREHPKAMTAIEVRNALEESGFNFDDFSNSLSACHAALKRIQSDDGEVEPGPTKDGKATYRRVIKLNAFTERAFSRYGKLAGLAGLAAPIDPEKLPDEVRAVTHPVDQLKRRESWRSKPTDHKK